MGCWCKLAVTQLASWSFAIWIGAADPYAIYSKDEFQTWDECMQKGETIVKGMSPETRFHIICTERYDATP